MKILKEEYTYMYSNVLLEPLNKVNNRHLAFLLFHELEYKYKYLDPTKKFVIPDDMDFDYKTVSPSTNARVIGALHQASNNAKQSAAAAIVNLATRLFDQILYPFITDIFDDYVELHIRSEGLHVPNVKDPAFNNLNMDIVKKYLNNARVYGNLVFPISAVIKDIKNIMPYVNKAKQTHDIADMSVAVTLALNVLHVGGNMLEDHGSLDIAFLDKLHKSTAYQLKWDKELIEEFQNTIQEAFMKMPDINNDIERVVGKLKTKLEDWDYLSSIQKKNLNLHIVPQRYNETLNYIDTIFTTHPYSKKKIKIPVLLSYSSQPGIVAAAGKLSPLLGKYATKLAAIVGHNEYIVINYPEITKYNYQDEEILSIIWHEVAHIIDPGADADYISSIAKDAKRQPEFDSDKLFYRYMTSNVELKALFAQIHQDWNNRINNNINNLYTLKLILSKPDSILLSKVVGNYMDPEEYNLWLKKPSIIKDLRKKLYHLYATKLAEKNKTIKESMIPKNFNKVNKIPKFYVYDIMLKTGNDTWVNRGRLTAKDIKEAKSKLQRTSIWQTIRDDSRLIVQYNDDETKKAIEQYKLQQANQHQQMLSRANQISPDSW